MNQQQNEIDKLNWKDIDIKSLLIVKEQGELLLKETTETSKIQTNRVLTIFKILLPLLIIVVGYLTSTRPSLEILWMESLLGLILLIILLPMILYAYRISSANVPGHYPSELLNEEYMSYANDSLYQYTLYNLCTVLEQKIEENKLINSRRARIIKNLEQVIVIGLSALIIYPFIWYFQHWAMTV